jgi:hypothetical protein
MQSSHENTGKRLLAGQNHAPILTPQVIRPCQTTTQPVIAKAIAKRRMVLIPNYVMPCLRFLERKDFILRDDVRTRHSAVIDERGLASGHKTF